MRIRWTQERLFKQMWLYHLTKRLIRWNLVGYDITHRVYYIKWPWEPKVCGRYPGWWRK
jgi:hypothetical protein